jgi:hypothetical protein
MPCLYGDGIPQSALNGRKFTAADGHIGIGDPVASLWGPRSEKAVNTWIVRRNGKDISVDLPKIRRWATIGYLKPDDLILRPDSQEWVHPDQLPELTGSRDSSIDGVAETEAPRSSSGIVVRQGDKEYCAADLEMLRTWVREGRVLLDSTFFDEQSKQWSYVGTLPAMASVPLNTPLRVVDLARSYRNLVVWVGLQIVFAIWFALAGSLALLVAPILLATVLALAYYAHETAKALGSRSALLGRPPC